jgi:NAD-dependent SIR2 family protein deacetylase
MFEIHESDAIPPGAFLMVSGDVPSQRCNRCGRKTWDAESFNREDRMTQPDDNPCGGRFTAATTEQAAP